MLTAFRRNRRERASGQIVVEFALLLPFFLLVIVGGVVEFGLSFYNYITLQQLANDAAQYAATRLTAADAGSVYTMQNKVYSMMQANRRRLIGLGTCSMNSVCEAKIGVLNLKPTGIVASASAAGIGVKLWRVDLEFKSPVWTPLYQFAMGLANGQRGENNWFFTMRSWAVFPTKFPAS